MRILKTRCSATDVAKYAGDTIIIEKTVIEDAGWFPSNTPPIPPKITIARQLIDWFVTLQWGRK
jgi:NAD+ diphosphatase